MLRAIVLSGNTFRLATAVLAFAAIVLLTAREVPAAVLTWGTPVNCTSDADVLIAGSSVWAYDWGGTGLTTATVNGVVFTAATAQNPTGITSPFTAFANNTFTSTSNPFNALSANYKQLLNDSRYITSTTAQTVTLTGLTSGHSYAVQVWANDPRSGGTATRTQTLSSSSGNSVLQDFNSTNAAGGVGQYSIGSFTADSASQTFTVTGNAVAQINTIQLRDVTGSWSGTTNGTWDESTVNFSGLSFGGVKALVGNVYFGDKDAAGNAVAQTTVNVTAGGVTGANIYFQNNSAAYTFTSSDAMGIYGGQSVTVQGTGTVTFGGANTYSGGTTINAGTLNVGNLAALGSGTVNVNGGTLNIGALGSTGVGAVTLTSGSITGTGSIAAASYTVQAGTASAGLAGAGIVLTKTTAGTVVLSGANTYSGQTSIKSGVLSVSSLNSVNGGTPLYPASSLGAPTTIANGTITIGDAATAGTLTYTGFGETTDRVIDLAGISGGAVLDQSGTGLLKFTSNLTATGAGSKTLTLQGSTAGTGEIAGIIADNGVGNLTSLLKTGTGRWTLSGANTHTGGTTVNAGTLALGAGGSLPAAGNITLSGTGVLDLGGQTPTYSGTISFQGGTLQNGTITNNTIAYDAQSGTLGATGTLAGTVGLNKSTTGALTIAGTASYSGNTSVAGGQLRINNASFSGFSGNLSLNGGVLELQSASGAGYTANLGTGAGEVQIPGGTSGFSSTIASPGATVTVNNGGNPLQWDSAAFAPTVLVFNDTTATGPLTFTSKVDLNGAARTVAVNANTATMTGEISGAAGSLVKTGAGTLRLSGPNTFTGKVTVASGTLSVGTLNSVTTPTPAVNSNLGVPASATDGTIDLGNSANAALVVTGTGETTDRSINLAGTTFSGTIDQSGTGLLKFTSDMTATGAGSKSLVLQGSTVGTGEFAGKIVDNSVANVTTVSKAGTGTWTLSNDASTYTGETIIGAGILNVTSVSNYGVASAIGARALSQENTTATGIGLHFTGGTLQYTGSTAQSTNREIRIKNGTTGGTIDASGSVPTATLSFTHTGANINLFDTTGTRTLTLTGTNTGDNTFAIKLENQSTNATSLVKSGVGKWILSGNSTYTGTTSINAGTLAVTGSLSGTAVTLNGGATLNLAVANALTGASQLTINGTSFTLDKPNNYTGIPTGTPTTYPGTILIGTNPVVTVTDPAGAGTGAIQANTGAVNPLFNLHIDGTGSNTTIAMPNAIGGNSNISQTWDVNNNGGGNTNNEIQLNGTAAWMGGGVTFNVTGGNGYSLYIGTVANGGGGAGGGSSSITFNPTTAALRLGSTATAHTTTTTVDTYVLDGTNAGNRITGVFADKVGGAKVAITKSNTSTWTLSGANTYTGPTIVNGGTLALDMSLNPTGVLPSASALTMGAGDLLVTGKSTGASAQTVASLATSGAGRIIVNPNGGTGTTLTITGTTVLPSAGGSVLFDTSAGTPATAMIAWNPPLNSGLIGPAYTIKDNAGFGFATVSGGYVVRDTSAILLTASNPTNPATNFFTNSNVNNTVSPTAELNSLLIDTAGGSCAWDLGGSTAAVTSGGLLMTGDNDHAIQNGSIKSLTATNSELVVNQTGAGTLTVSAAIVNGNGVSTLTKTGRGTLVLSGTNTYSGATVLNGGTLKTASPSALPAATTLTTATGTTLDLFGNNVTVTNLTGNAAANITDTGAGTGTEIDKLTITALAPGNATIANLITDGPSRKIQVVVSNGNSSGATSNLNNTYSGGLVLTNNQRITPINGATVVGGVVTKGPYGTGPIYLGLSPTDKANIYFNANNLTIANDIIVNTTLGTDRSGIRVDNTGNIISGAIKANLSDVAFSTNGTGVITLTGPISSGASPTGLRLDSNWGTKITVVLNNATATPNSYTGDNTITAKGVLSLGAADQIPNGAGKGNVTLQGGTLSLNGFNETINGLNGTGTVDGVSGTPTLTAGDNDAAGAFGGVIKNTAGTLALTKIGAGALNLSGASTYTGATTVNAGTLLLSGSGDINATSGISINGSNAQFVQNSSVPVTVPVVLTQGTLAGTGTVGAVAVANAAANTVAAGYAGAGTLSTGPLTFSGAGTAAFGDLVNYTFVPGIDVAGNLTASGGAGSVAVSIRAPISASGGPYHLLRYSGTLNDFTAFTLATLPCRATGGLVDNSLAGYIDLNITGFDTTNWVGATSAWDTTTLGNWKLGSGPATTFMYLDGVVFGDAATSKTVDVSAADVHPASVTFNNSLGNDYLLQGGKAIAGWTALTKSGGGKLTIANSNSFSGQMSVQEGTVSVATLNSAGADGPLGNSILPVALGAAGGLTGALEYTGASAASSKAFTLPADGTGVISLASPANLTLSGTIDGTGNLTVLGVSGSKLTLTANNSFTGRLSVKSGTVAVGTINNTGVAGPLGGGTQSVVLGDTGSTGTLEYTGASATSTRPFTLATGGTGAFSVPTGVNLTLSGMIDGSGTLSKSGAGQMNLAGTGNMYTGGTVVTGGVLEITDDAHLGMVPSSPAVNITLDGGQLNNNAGNDLTVNANRTILLGSGGGYFRPRNAKNFTLAGKVTGSGGLGVVWDQQAIVLSNTGNDYSGDTTIGVNGNGEWVSGTSNAYLRVGSLNVLPYGPGKGNVIVGTNSHNYPATLDLNGFDLQINGLSNGAGNTLGVVDNKAGTGSYTLTLGNGDANGSFAGAIKNTSGTVALTKVGTGTQTLAGANTYAGATTVSNGRLTVTGSIPNTSSATIAATTATLELAGTGPVTPIGLDVSNAGTLEISTANQQLGDISGAGTTNVKASAGLIANSIVQDTLTIGAGGSVTIRETPVLAGAADASAVPEPATWALIGIGLLSLLAFRRRR